MKDAGGERAARARLAEDVAKMFPPARAARGDNRNRRRGDHRRYMLQVIALPHAVASHAVEHDLAGASVGRLAYPVEGAAPGAPHAAGLTRILLDDMIALLGEAVDAKHDALAAKVAGEFLDQLRMFQRRGIDGYLVGPGLKASGRLLARPEASATVNGMSIPSAMRFTQATSRERPSALAVMS